MSSDHDDAKASGRRQFIKLASLGAVAGAVAAVAGEGRSEAKAGSGPNRRLRGIARPRTSGRFTSSPASERPAATRP